MHFLNIVEATALGEMLMPPPAEVIDDELPREALLLELRALHIVLAQTEMRLEVSRLRDEQFEQLTRAYQVALAACAREERLRRDLDGKLAATAGPLCNRPS